MRFNNLKRAETYSKLLAPLYIISCALELFCVWTWNGGMILFVSIFLFGLPLIFVLLPILGAYMFKAKRGWSILLSYLCSLTALPFLITACRSFPLRRMIDARPHYERLSITFSVATVVSLAFFLIIATVSMVYCLKTYQLGSK